MLDPESFSKGIKQPKEPVVQQESQFHWEEFSSPAKTKVIPVPPKGTSNNNRQDGEGLGNLSSFEL
jgi:hypothetical protein